MKGTLVQRKLEQIIKKSFKTRENKYGNFKNLSFQIRGFVHYQWTNVQ